MTTFKHILVGTDFSTHAGLAIDEAVRLMRRHGSKLTVVHSLPDLPPDMQSVSYWRADFDPVKAAQDNARKRLAAQLESLAGDPDIRTSVVSGKPALTLIEFAIANECDLIVVGQTGVSGLERALLGSTAERLLRSAPQAVLVVRPHKQPGFQRILVPTDFSPCAEEALELALKLAGDERSELHLLHVFDQTELARIVELSPLMPYTEIEKRLHQSAKAALDALQVRASPRVASCKRHLESGIASVSIIDYVTAHDCDLVVMGSVGRRGLNGLFIGNTAERVVRNVSCSLLTVKPKDFPFRGA